MNHLKLYKSSAGSGKTFTLVKEYLKICLPQPEKFRRVVAITFTNAAASEMKERIVSKLEQLSLHEDLPYEQMLLSEGLTQAQVNNAAILLEQILYNYADFHISTIDSFFHKILRAFSKELNLPMNFDIFLDTQEALDYAVDNFLYRSHLHADVHTILISYVKEQVESGKTWNVRSNLSSMAKELVKDGAFLKQETDLLEIAGFIDELRRLIKEFEDENDKIGRETLQQLDELGITHDDLKGKSRGPLNHFNKIQKWKKDYQPTKTFTNAVYDAGEWLPKGYSRAIEDAVETIILPKAQQVFELFETHHAKYVSAREILRNIYTFAVYEELNKLLAEYREKNDVILVSDFTKIIAKHIVNEDIDFIFSKIGARFDHFLIDEFQDTSALQWLGLKPLVENAVSQGTSCLLVGDSKQAIYRWRGGQVELIETQISERDFPQQCSRISLEKNFRSKTEVVEFNNRFFNRLKAFFEGDIYEYKLLKQIFEDVAQEPGAQNREGGYVQVNFLSKEGRSNESYYEKCREKVLEAIQNSKESGYKLKDICILVRDGKDATDMAQLLFENGIDFITQDSLTVDHSPVVRLIFSLLFYINDPRDTLAKTQLTFLYLTYFEKPENEIDFSELMRGVINTETGLFEKYLPKEFTENIFTLSLLPLYELVEELVRIFKLNKKPDAYLQRMQEVVLEFSQTKHRGITAFLDWWKAGKYSVVLPDDQDAVQIMTIHKSKGLEFPVVIMPFASWDFGSKNPSILWVEPQDEPFNRFKKLPLNYTSKLAASTFLGDYDREEALIAIDNLNLLYVAFTRARERLYINTQTCKTSAEGIKNTSQVINMVLRGETNTENEGQLIFGSAQNAVAGLHSVKNEQFILMPEYPVYNWREKNGIAHHSPESEGKKLPEIPKPGQTSLFS